MEIKTAVVADAANISGEGKLNITGIFDRITSSSFPVTWPAMDLVVRLEAHSSEVGEHEIQINVVNEDGRKLGRINGGFDLGPADDQGVPPHGNFIVPIRMATFPEPGTYSFDILVDGRYEDSVRLVVRKR